jgi:hypothetical protein
MHLVVLLLILTIAQLVGLTVALRLVRHAAPTFLERLDDQDGTTLPAPPRAPVIQ